MRNLVAFPILTLAVIVQSSIVSGIPLLRGYADLTLVIVIAWSLQEETTTAWHWAIVAGVLTSFVTSLPWAIPMSSFLVAILFSTTLQKRIWQAPLIALFTVTFLASLFSHLLTIAYLNITGSSISFTDAFSLVTLPSLLINLFIAIPVFWLMRDLARWIYPIEEEEE